jgi:hypothetical protein
VLLNHTITSYHDALKLAPETLACERWRDPPRTPETVERLKARLRQPHAGAEAAVDARTICSWLASRGLYLKSGSRAHPQLWKFCARPGALPVLSASLAVRGRDQAPM